MKDFTWDKKGEEDLIDKKEYGFDIISFDVIANGGT